MNVLGWACVVALGVLLFGAGAAVAWLVGSSVWGAWRDVQRKREVDHLQRGLEGLERLRWRVRGAQKRGDLPWPEDERT